MTATAATTASPATTPIEAQCFGRSGMLAVDPQAFGIEFPLCITEPAEPFRLEAEGKAAVVTIGGPITFDGFFFDTYAAIQGRVAAALDSGADAVILEINSPGGDVFGAFDTARALRAMAGAAGKPLIAFTAAQAASAAYALASAAGEIVITDSAQIGSIGVIHASLDVSAANAEFGVVVHLIKSGQRKDDGSAEIPMSDAARAAIQIRVDETAEIFFDLVAVHRGLKSSDVKALEADQFVGASAVAAGLADRVSSFGALIQSIATRDPGATLGTTDMPDPNDDDAAATAGGHEDDEDATRAALVTAAESDDEAKAGKAKRALAAYDAQEEDEDDKDKDDEAKAKAAAAAAAASDHGDEDKDDATAAAASSLAATVQAQGQELAALRKTKTAVERADYLATRPDLSPAILKSLAGVSLAQVRKIVDAIPKGPDVAADPAAGATRGDHAASGLHPETSARLDAQMGMGETEKVTQNDDVTMKFGVLVPKAKAS